MLCNLYEPPDQRFSHRLARWETSSLSRRWPQAAGSRVAEGVPAAGPLCRFFQPARHHLCHLQPGPARLALRGQEAPQQQGKFKGCRRKKNLIYVLRVRSLNHYLTSMNKCLVLFVPEHHPQLNMQSCQLQASASSHWADFICFYPAQTAEGAKTQSHPVSGEIQVWQTKSAASLKPSISDRNCSSQPSMPLHVLLFFRPQLQIHYDKQLGNLIVHVLQARNLALRDNNGYSDPFVKVYLLPGRGWVKAGPICETYLQLRSLPGWGAC